MSAITISSPSLTLTTHKQQHQLTTTILRPHQQPPRLRIRQRSCCCFYKVRIEQEGEIREVEVEEDETILEKALESGMSVPYDCKLGVCMTCPAKLVSGSVDQSEGMLSDDVIEKGYSLLCVSYPKSDCCIQIIPEEELLSLQLATADD